VGARRVCGWNGAGLAAQNANALPSVYVDAVEPAAAATAVSAAVAAAGAGVGLLGSCAETAGAGAMAGAGAITAAGSDVRHAGTYPNARRNRTDAELLLKFSSAQLLAIPTQCSQLERLWGVWAALVLDQSLFASNRPRNAARLQYRLAQENAMQCRDWVLRRDRYRANTSVHGCLRPNWTYKH